MEIVVMIFQIKRALCLTVMTWTWCNTIELCRQSVCAGLDLVSRLLPKIAGKSERLTRTENIQSHLGAKGTQGEGWDKTMSLIWQKSIILPYCIEVYVFAVILQATLIHLIRFYSLLIDHFIKFLNSSTETLQQYFRDFFHYGQVCCYWQCV